MERNPTSQQVTWFLDLNRTDQLNLDPSYQRRSVWNIKDRQYFLDTIFKNYPCPTIFINKETDENGKTTYNVVDGKQRLQTILMFSNNGVALSKEFGDINLDGKLFEELTPLQKKIFWDYILTVDFVEASEVQLINEIFDRLNKNAKNLNKQELRHAKYNGWFITEVEKESEAKFWEEINISTRARIKRMSEVQLISELLFIILDQKIVGFDQDYLNEQYAKYEVLEDGAPEFKVDGYIEEKERIKNYLIEMEKENNVISNYANLTNNLYPLWGLITLTKENFPPPNELAIEYLKFMELVKTMNEETVVNRGNKLAHKYYLNSRGAATDFPLRNERLKALKKFLLGI